MKLMYMCSFVVLDIKAGFFLFCTTEKERDTTLSQLSVAERQQEVANRWQALSADDKDAWARLAMKDPSYKKSAFAAKTKLQPTRSSHGDGPGSSSTSAGAKGRAVR